MLTRILSPSWKSMARLVLPSRLELKRPVGSSKEAPLARIQQKWTPVLRPNACQIFEIGPLSGQPTGFHSA